MFFNNELLTKKRGGFGVIWLAATLGTSGHKLKKLTKRELLSCNVVKACQKLIEPEEPLALRLSSNLMLGVTRIYSHQWIILHQDATTTSTSLRKAFTAYIDFDPDHNPAIDDGSGKFKKGERRGGVKKIDLANNGNARNGHAINLNILRAGEAEGEMNDIGLGMEDLLWQDLQDQLAQHQGRNVNTNERKRSRAGTTPGIDFYNGGDEEGEDLDNRNMADDDDYLESHKKKKAKQEPRKRKETSNIAREEDINLPAHHDLDLMDFDNNDIDFPPENNNGLPNDDGFELDMGFDLADLANIDPANSNSSFTNLTGLGPPPSTSADRSNIANNRGPEGFQNGLGGFEFDGNDFGELDLGLEDLVNGGLPPPLNGNVPDDGNVPPASREGSPKASDARKSATVVPSSQSPPRPAGDDLELPEKNNAVANEEDGAAEGAKVAKKTTRKATKSKATKSKATVKDKVIELDSGDLVKARDAYSDEMKKLNDVKKVEKDSVGQVKMARICIFQVPVGIHAPELREFLDKVVNMQEIMKQPPAKAGRKVKRASSELSAGPNKKQRKDNLEREGTAISSQMARNNNRAASAQLQDEGYYAPRDFDAFQANDFDNFDNAGPYLEDGRGSRAPSVEIGRTRQPSKGYDNESNIGRERQASVAYNQSMPWNDPENLSDLMRPGPGGPSSSQRSFMARRSIGDRSDQIRARSRSPSIGLQHVDIGIRSRSASFNLPTRIGSASSALLRRESSLLGPLPGNDHGPGASSSQQDIDLGPDADVKSDVPGSQATGTEGETQRAARLDMETARFLDYAKRQARIEDNGILFFSDIVPVAATKPNVAAMAFYHTLVLASKKAIEVVGQPEPYGEIELAIPEFVF